MKKLTAFLLVLLSVLAVTPVYAQGVTQATIPWKVSFDGVAQPVSATQGTSPWVVSFASNYQVAQGSSGDSGDPWFVNLRNSGGEEVEAINTTPDASSVGLVVRNLPGSTIQSVSQQGSWVQTIRARATTAAPTYSDGSDDYVSLTTRGSIRAELWSTSSGIPIQVSAGTNSSGTNILPAGVLAQYDDVASTTLTENNFGNLRLSANRNLYGTIRDAAGNERGANVNVSNELTTITKIHDGTDTALVTAAGALSGDVSSIAGTATSTGVGASGSGTQRVAALLHDGTDTALIATDGTLQAAPAVTNVVSISTSESVAAPTADTWYIKRQWALPASARFTPTRAWAAVTTAGSRTIVGVINNLGNLNLSTNTFTQANSVASPYFYGRLFGCVTTVMSATSDNVTVTYTDELGNSQSAAAVTFASASPVGNCMEIPLNTSSGAALDAGVRAVTAATDSAAPTGVVTFYGVSPLLDTVGPASTLDSTVLDTGELNANEQIVILLRQAATTAQQRSAGLTGALR